VEDTKGVDESTDNSIINKGKKYPLAAKEAWLKENAKAFHLLREGLKYPALSFPSLSLFDMSFHEYAKDREMARGLAVESHARGERGDWNGALQSALDDYDFGNQIACGRPLDGALVSIAIRAISLHELEILVSHTNATTAKMAAVSMEKAYENRYPFYKTLQEEKWLNISQTLQLMSTRSWRIDLMHSFNIPVINNAKMLLISDRKVISDMTALMDALIENAQRPYLKMQVVPPSDDPIVELIVFRGSKWLWARNNTFALEIMTMYALRAYKMDNGHYPKNLKALMPTYLHKIPIDPWDGIAPLHYQLQENKYLLWSIGPDGVDNHGTPIFDPNAGGTAPSIPNNVRYEVSRGSAGDVVAGINTP
jgi:hypothetical protein